MKIKQLRGSFTVFFLDSKLERGRRGATALSSSGYSAELFTDPDSLFEAVRVSPPHIVFFQFSDVLYDANRFIADSIQLLPELHAVGISDDRSWSSLVSHYESSLYDGLRESQDISQELIRSADRAALSDYYMYQNEQLKERLNNAGVEEAPVNLALFDFWLKQLYSQNSYEDCIDQFLSEVSRHVEGAPVIFLKYLPSRQSLVISQSAGVPLSSLRGVGFQLGENSDVSPAEQFADLDNMEGLRLLVEKALPNQNYSAFSLHDKGDVHGVFAVFNEEKTICEEGQLVDEYIAVCLRALGETLKKLALEKIYHKVSQLDEATGVQNRSSFINKVNQEISRSRRTSLPVSLAVFEMNDFKDFMEKHPAEGKNILKSVAAIYKNNSRINDLVGRLGTSQLGVLMPHTHKEGAAIKAERLRRVIEGADFSGLSQLMSSVTVSAGVSEYPSLSHDADELLESADGALAEVLKVGKNKVCLASVDEGFLPDFIIK